MSANPPSIDTTTASVAVRVLCAFAAKAGDLDLRFTPSPSAQDGIAGHTTVTARRAAGYQREVPLSARCGELRVQGRADGFDPAVPRLEEIKTHRGDAARIPDNHRELHWAQARVYGWMLCEQHALERIELALVYFNIDTAQETVLPVWHSAVELKAFFETLCARYAGWARAELAHRAARDAALRALAFPFEGFRPGQRELAAAVYRCHGAGRHLLAQAPTGIGKTMATLFAALRAAPAQGTHKLFYLTAKTPGRQLALHALQRMKAQPLRVLELVARDKACEHPDKACHGESCPLARGFYDRLPAAREAAAQAGWLDKAALREIALRHEVCPYYLGQDLLRWSDVVVGDFNHFFDLSAHAWSLTVGDGLRVGLLVDEAHNLIERARLMYSAELRPATFQAVRKGAPAALKKTMDRLQRPWSALARQQTQDHTVLPELPGAFIEALQRHSAALSDHLALEPEGAHAAGLQDWLFEAQRFLRVAEVFADHSLVDLTPAPRAAGAQHPQPRPRPAAAAALAGRAQRHAVLGHAQPHGLRERPAGPAARHRAPVRALALRCLAAAGARDAEPLHPLRRPRRLARPIGRGHGRPVRPAARQLPGLLQQLRLPAAGAATLAGHAPGAAGVGAVARHGRTRARGLRRALHRRQPGHRLRRAGWCVR